MVTSDALSKYVLASSLMDDKINPKTESKYTQEEAYMEASNTFLDYRNNLPQEIKSLSDYGILMFPAFWIRIQRVIMGLLRYHPVSAVGGYAMSDLLNAGGTNVIDTNIINKISDGTIINDPGNILDWNVLSPFL